MKLQISEAGLKLIMDSEGFEPRPRPCPAGKPSVGYGHVVRPGEVFDHPLTEEEGRDLLRRDVKVAEEAVNRLVTVEVDQGKFDALVSFTFNLGEGALSMSTLLTLVNQRRFSLAALEFRRWRFIKSIDRKTGRKKLTELPGLVTRRAAEAALFKGGEA